MFIFIKSVFITAWSPTLCIVLGRALIMTRKGLMYSNWISIFKNNIFARCTPKQLCRVIIWLSINLSFNSPVSMKRVISFLIYFILSRSSMNSSVRVICGLLYRLAQKIMKLSSVSLSCIVIIQIQLRAQLEPALLLRCSARLHHRS